jgi:hypothetical protein
MARPKSFRSSDVQRAITIIKNAGYRIVSVQVDLAGGVRINVLPDGASMTGEGCHPEIRTGEGEPSASVEITEADLDRELTAWKTRHGH